MRIFLASVLCLLLPFGAHAGQPEFVQLSPDTYMVVVKNHAGIFGNPQTTKLKAIKAANEYAKKLGKIAIPVALEATPAGGPGHWPAVEYQFRVVSPDDPEAQRTSLVPRPDITVDVKPQPAQAPVPVTTAQSKPDLYSELLKLNDLKKRGIISEEEFETMKQRLLEE